MSGPGASPPRPSPAVITAVRGSLQAVASRPVALAESFYAELFAMEPALRGMFPADMTGQMLKMTDTLVGAISALDTPDLGELEAALRTLGADHRTRFGVENGHYAYIGHALTRAVRDVAGPAYSGSLSSAWIALYQWVAAHMTAGADAADKAQPPPIPIPPQTPRPVGDMPAPRTPRDDQRIAPRGPARR